MNPNETTQGRVPTSLEAILTVAECARLLRLSEATIRRHIRWGRIHVIQHGERRAIRIKRENCCGGAAPQSPRIEAADRGAPITGSQTKKPIRTLPGPPLKWQRRLDEEPKRE